MGVIRRHRAMHALRRCWRCCFDMRVNPLHINASMPAFLHRSRCRVAALLRCFIVWRCSRRSRRIRRVAIYIEARPGVAWRRRGCCQPDFSSSCVAFHRFSAGSAATNGVVVTFSSLR